MECAKKKECAFTLDCVPRVYDCSEREWFRVVYVATTIFELRRYPRLISVDKLRRTTAEKAGTFSGHMSDARTHTDLNTADFTSDRTPVFREALKLTRFRLFTQVSQGAHSRTPTTPYQSNTRARLSGHTRHASSAHGALCHEIILRSNGTKIYCIWGKIFSLKKKIPVPKFRMALLSEKCISTKKGR